MDKIKDLEKQIFDAQQAYYNGSEIISDDEYDALVYELSTLDPSNAILSIVGADPVNSWVKEKHLVTLGSLNKVNFPNEMEAWININLKKQPVLVVEKLDGLSLGLQYENGQLKKACLRGSGLEGENILVNVLKMKNVVKSMNSDFSGTIRGEIMLTKSDHLKHFPEYSNPRNAASGLCRRFDGVGSQHLSLLVYDIIGDVDFDTEEDKFKFLSNHGFTLPNFKFCKKASQVNDLWKEYQDKTRASLDYEIDGLVVYCNSIEVQHAMDDGSTNPKYKMAFKFANQFVKSTVTKIEWLVGNSGRITPRCWFEPVNLLGSTIEKASVYNIAYIDKLGLGVGSEILVCKANEIIPRVEKVVKSSGSIEKIPTNCPHCDSVLKMVGENLQCLNSENCFGQITGRIENWVKELNILELGVGLINKLVESGLVKDVSDLYKLDVDDIANLDRMGEKSAQNVFDSLWKNNPVALELFIGGLSISMIGSSTIKLLIEAGYDSLDKIMALDVDQIEAVKGIGPIKAETLVSGLKHYKPVIDKLLDNGLEVKEKIVGKLTGCKIAITGSTKNKRAVLEKFIIDNGGENKSSVSKSCTHLVIADVNSSSSKAIAARKLDIKLLDEESLLNMVI